MPIDNVSVKTLDKIEYTLLCLPSNVGMNKLSIIFLARKYILMFSLPDHNSFQVRY